MAAEKPRRPSSALETAEAVFKPAPIVAKPDRRVVTVPRAKESVTVRLDQDVIAHFQDEGLGWQDRMNATLRKALGFD